MKKNVLVYVAPMLGDSFALHALGLLKDLGLCVERVDLASCPDNDLLVPVFSVPMVPRGRRLCCAADKFEEYGIAVPYWARWCTRAIALNAGHLDIYTCSNVTKSDHARSLTDGLREANKYLHWTYNRGGPTRKPMLSLTEPSSSGHVATYGH